MKHLLSGSFAGHKPLTPARIRELRKKPLTLERLLEVEEFLENNFKEEDKVLLTAKDKSEAEALLKHLEAVGFAVRKSSVTDLQLFVQLPVDLTKEKIIIGSLALLVCLCIWYANVA